MKALSITFGDFPMQPIGRAKNLKDENPDSADFFESKEPRFKKRGLWKAMRGTASPLPPRRTHPRHKWRGILRGSHNPPPEKGPSGMPIATLIGEYYSRNNENVATSGRLKDLLSHIAADT